MFTKKEAKFRYVCYTENQLTIAHISCEMPHFLLRMFSYSTLFYFLKCEMRLTLLSCNKVSWCSWSSRQSNTLKVSGSSPDEANLWFSSKSHLSVVLLEHWNQRFTPQTSFKKSHTSPHMRPTLCEFTQLPFIRTCIVWPTLREFVDHITLTWRWSRIPDRWSKTQVYNGGPYILLSLSISKITLRMHM